MMKGEERERVVPTWNGVNSSQVKWNVENQSNHIPQPPSSRMACHITSHQITSHHITLHIISSHLISSHSRQKKDGSCVTWRQCSYRCVPKFVVSWFHGRGSGGVAGVRENISRFNSTVVVTHNSLYPHHDRRPSIGGSGSGSSSNGAGSRRNTALSSARKEMSEDKS